MSSAISAALFPFLPLKAQRKKMHSTKALVALVCLLAQPARAQVAFEGDDLAKARLGLSCFFLLATLVELVLLFIGFARMRSPHLLPLALACVTAVIFFLSWCIDVPYTVFSYLGYTDFLDFEPFATPQALNALSTAELFLAEWTEPAMVLTLAMIVYDRARPRGFGLHGAFLAVVIALSLLMWTFGTASTGLSQSAQTALLNRNITPREYRNQIETSINLGYVFVAFYIVGCIVVSVWMILTKIRLGADKVLSRGVLLIVPPLLIRALARMILVIVGNQLAKSATVTSTDFENFNIADIIFNGLPYFVIFAVLINLFYSPQLWSFADEPQHRHGLAYGAPQPASYTHTGNNTQYSGGFSPAEAFPGQWGNTGQPVMQTYNMHGAPGAQQPYLLRSPSSSVPSPSRTPEIKHNSPVTDMSYA